ncbi:MAG: TonB-dependent receptor [Sphingomonadaceae bacterium]|nr:TonB-dependent receptor [Sphingomonadaceae bacterium]
MKISKMHLLVTTAPLAAMLLSTPSYAQDKASDDTGIEEIIVTAQRREENLQDVPISVSAFTAEQMAARGTSDISRLEGQVPGFTFGRSGSDARPAIRGVRTENVGVNGDTTIGFFIDGVYQSRASQATTGFVDIERVEVQRGPQGTLYGRNTFGGNIVISSAKPSLEGYFGGMDLTVGENGRFRTDAFVNAALSDSVAIRIAGSYEKSDGYVKNVNPLGNNLFDDDNRYVRGSLLLQPNDAFSALIKFDYSRRVGAGGSAFGYKLAGSYFDVASRQQLYNATPVFGLNTRGGNRDGVNDALPGSAVATSDLGVPIFAAGDPYTIDTDQKTILDLENKAWTANLAYDFGPVTVKSITGYTDFGAIRTSDTDFSANQIGVDFQDTRAKTFSQELQLLSSDTESALTYVLGAYYFKDKLTGIFINEQYPRIIRNVTPNLNLAANGGGFYDQQRAKTESYAAYAQASYAITEQLKFTAGVRYTSDKKDFAFANANAILPTAGTPPVPQGTAITLRTGPIPDSAFGVQGAATNCTFTNFPPRSGFQCLASNTTILTGATYDTKKFNKTTWRAGLDYQLSDDNLMYASVSTGFRSGGFNSGQGPAALQPTFNPETVIAYEIGSKNRFADNTIQINLAAFYNNYKGLQEQRQVPVGATTLSIIENSGKARSYGAEAEMIWQPVDALQIGATFAYLNAKYTEYRDVPAPFGTTILVADAAALTPTVVNGVTIAPAGQRRLFAPGYKCGLVAGTGGAGQPAAAYGCDISGNSIPYSPEFTGAVYASYEIDLGSAGTLTPYASINFSSSFFGQPFNSILEKQDAFNKIDLRLTWAYNENVSIQGFVTNVTDKVTSTRFVWGGGGALQASYAPPRLWGARASFKF